MHTYEIIKNCPIGSFPPYPWYIHFNPSRNLILTCFRNNNYDDSHVQMPNCECSNLIKIFYYMQQENKSKKSAAYKVLTSVESNSVLHSNQEITNLAGAPPAIFGRKLQKVGPNFIQNCGNSRSHKPVSRYVMSSIFHSF